MIGSSSQPSFVFELSQRAFARLLFLYPREYRQEYGPHMAQLFKDCSREAASQGSAAALLELWVSTLLDVFKTALEQHMKEFWHMNKERSIRTAGWALMLGTALFILVLVLGNGQTSYDDPLGGSDALYEYVTLGGGTLAMLSFAVGAWLLSANYAAALGGSAKNALIWSTLAAVISAVGVFFLGLQIELNGWAWGMFFIGMLAYMLGLGVFGVAAVRKKALPGFSTLLAVGGLSLPILAAISIVLELVTDADYVWSNWILSVLLIVAFAAVFLVGAQLARAPQLAKATR